MCSLGHVYLYLSECYVSNLFTLVVIWRQFGSLVSCGIDELTLFMRLNAKEFSGVYLFDSKLPKMIFNE